MGAYVIPLALLGGAFLAGAGLLNGHGPRVAWAFSAICFVAAFILSLVSR